MSYSSRRPISASSTITGSLIEETYLIFQDWNFSESKTKNLSRVRETNPIGAGSSSWLYYVTKTLSRRFEPNHQDKVLVQLAQDGCDREVWKPILLWHITRRDFLIRDFLSQWLYQQYLEGVYRLRTTDVIPYIKNLSHRKDVSLPCPWSPKTITRVSSSLLRIAVDFGLMKGKLNREFIPYYLPDTSFLYLLHSMTESEPNAQRMIQLPDWQIYRMDAAQVERELLRLHQFHQLSYEVAGSLAQIQLPCKSSEDYARRLVA